MILTKPSQRLSHLRGLKSFWILVLPVMLVIFAYGCSLEERKSSGVRGHTENYQSVYHGFAPEKGARFCQDCHGQTLMGGSQGEPSCFKCHGLNWLDLDPAKSQAPDDHTATKGLFNHHPSLKSPTGTCTNCHGADLKGDKNLLTPSCYLCHADIWN
jgi:hypothetical protein